MGRLWMDILFGQKSTRSILVELPNEHVSGVDTLVWMHNQGAAEEEKITRDDVVQAALDDYLTRSIWTTKQVKEKPLAIPKEPETFGSGRMQRRTR